MESIANFLKKEYKKITKEVLSLKKFKEPQIELSNTSRIRSWVVAKCFYEIGNIKIGSSKDEAKDKLDTEINSWLAKRSKNILKLK